MSTIVTNQGLNLPDNLTEEQFFEAGRFLSRIEQGMQWAIGDWYNAIPWGDKEAACAEAGLNYKTAREYAWVAEVFEMSVRTDKLSFAHHRKLAIDDLTATQRGELLRQAEEEGWSSARLTAERDVVLGRKKASTHLVTLDQKVDALTEKLPSNLPKATKQKVQRTLRDMQHEVEKTVAKQLEKMQADFDAEVNKRASDLAKAQRDKVHEIQKELEAEREQLRGLRMNLDGLMTESEYRAVRRCLHPDTAKSATEVQLNNAFLIFERLRKSVNRDMPAELRKKRGWAA